MASGGAARAQMRVSGKRGVKGSMLDIRGGSLRLAARPFFALPLVDVLLAAYTFMIASAPLSARNRSRDSCHAIKSTDCSGVVTPSSESTGGSASTLPVEVCSVC